VNRLDKFQRQQTAQLSETFTRNTPRQRWSYKAMRARSALIILWLHFAET